MRPPCSVLESSRSKSLASVLEIHRHHKIEPLSNLLQVQRAKDDWCRREDSNLHALTGTTP
jgi:hypothetical protein